MNQTIRDALADITKKAKEFVKFQRGDFALDMGCNDGILLKSYGNTKLDLY